MLNNALAYFSPPSTPRKSVMQFFENLNPLNSFKSDSENHQIMSHLNQEASGSGHDKSLDTKSLKSASKNNPMTPKSAAAAFNFSNNTIVPSTSASSVYPTTLSPAAIILEKPPSGRASRPLSVIMGKKKKPPPPPPLVPCEPTTSLATSESSSPEVQNQEIDPEILAGALAKAGLLEEKKEVEEEEIEASPALFPPRPPKPNHLSRSSSMKPVSPSPSSNSIDMPPPIPPKTYKKNYGYSS